MKKALLLLLAVLALIVAGPASADTKTVQITSKGFVPSNVSAQTGDTVTFRNVDAATHQVVADDGSFASLALKAGDTYSTTPTKPGKVRFHDTNSKFTGTLSVTGALAPALTLTLAASQLSVVYGGAVALTGTVSSQQPGETVVLQMQQYGDTKVDQQAATATTTTGGSYTFTVSPSIQAAYSTKVKSASSQTITIGVKPRVGFGLAAGGVFTARVTAGRSFAGRAVYLQRRTTLGQWLSVKKVILTSSSTVRFRARLPKGLNRVRVVITQNQAGPGYLAGTSAIKLVRR